MSQSKTPQKTKRLDRSLPVMMSAEFLEHQFSMQHYFAKDSSTRTRKSSPSKTLRVRPTKLEKAEKLKDVSVKQNRSLKQKRISDCAEPQSGEKICDPETTATETRVIISNHISLLDGTKGLKPLTPEEKKYAHFRLLKEEFEKRGLRKNQYWHFLQRDFPEFTQEAHPQGLHGFLPMAFHLSEDSIKNFMADASNIASKFKPSMNVGVDQPTQEFVGNTVAKLADVVEKASTSLNDLLYLLLAIIIVVIYKPKTTVEKGMVGFMIVGIIASKHGIQELYKNSSLFAWLTKPADGVRPQALTLDETTVMIAGLINSYLLLTVGKNICSPSELSKVIGTIGRTTIGVASIMKAIHLFTAYIHAAIDKYYNGNEWFVKSGHTFIDEFLKEANDIIFQHEEKKMLELQSSLDRVKDAITLGESIQIKIPGTPDMVGLRLHVNNALAELKRIKKYLVSSSFKFAGMRQKPASLLMMGSPGVGKSQALQHFANAVMALNLNPEEYELYKENPGTQIFNRMAENVHWDGYKNSHNIVFFDDVFQAVDIVGQPDNEAMNVIRSVNIFDYPLHCAAMESKGNTNFTANFVIANTNMDNFKFNSINQPGAVMRRWDIAVKVYPKKQYCIDPSVEKLKRRFDQNKLEKFKSDDPALQHLIGDTCILPTFCEYELFKLDHEGTQFIPDPDGGTIEFNELVIKYYDVYLREKRYHEIHHAGTNQTLKEFRAIYEERQKTKETLFETEEELTLQMEEVSPQAGRDVEHLSEFFESWTNSFEYNPSRPIQVELARLQLNNPDAFVKIDTLIKYVFARSLINGRDMNCDEVCSLVIRFVIDEGFENEGVEWYEKHSIMLCERYYLTKFDRHWLTTQALSSIAQAQLFIQQNKLAWSTSDTWSAWIFKVYQITLVHAKTFGIKLHQNGVQLVRAWMGKMDENIMLWGPITGVTLQLAYHAIKFLLGKLFPRDVNKELEEKVQEKILESEDVGVKEASSKLVEAEKALEAARIELAVKTAPIQAIALKELSEPHSDVRSGRMRISRNIRVPPKAQPQGIQTINFNLMSIMDAVCKRNQFAVYFPAPFPEREDGKMHRRAGYALCITGRIMLVPHHFLSYLATNLREGMIAPNELVFFKRPQSGYKMLECTVEEVIDGYVENEEAEQQDLLMFSLPDRIPACRSCVKFIATEEQHRLYTKFDAALHIPSSGTKEIQGLVATRGANLQVENEQYAPYSVKQTYTYRSFTKTGDCGSLLLVNDTHKTSPIVGMHVAGYESKCSGFSSVLTREFVTRYLALFPQSKLGQADALPDIPALNLHDPEDRVIPNMFSLGTFKPDRPYPRNIGKSKIVRSHLHGKVSEVTKAPAKLKPFLNQEGVRVDPMQIALSKYCAEDVYIDTNLIKEAASQLFIFLKRNEDVKIQPESFSFEVAVKGDESEWWNAIPRSTSSGYPWNCMSGTSAKTRFWGTGPEYDLETAQAKELQLRVENLIAKAKQGIRGVHLYTDCLKDERRSFKKVRLGMTRLISCSPVDLLIAFRMKFGAAIKSLAANKISNGMAVGVNEHGPEWDLIARRLNRWGDIQNKGAGDYEGFDMKHKNSIGWTILEIINRWYGEDNEDNIVRNTLWFEVVNSYHINDGEIFEWFTALPSGAPPTTMFNCLANLLYFRMAWLELSPPGLLFEDHVYLIVLGDDNVFAVNPEVSDFFTEKEISVIMRKYGHVFTPEDKELKEHKHQLRMITEVSFLKRKFRYSSEFGRYVGPLDIESILDMLQWQKDSSSSYADCDVLVTTALEELAFHPKEVFDFYAKKIISAVEETDGLIYPRLDSYHAAIRVHKERELGGMMGHPFFTDLRLLQNESAELLKNERFEEEGSAFLNVTPRALRWQPQSSSGTRGTLVSLVQDSNFKRTATTTNKEGNSITASASIGQTDQSIFETSRTPQMVSDQTSDTSKFTVDADTPKTMIASYRPLNPSLLDSARTGATQDVGSFLAKPITIATGNFTSNDSFASFIYLKPAIPQSILYEQPLWYNKLAGNLAFKGTLHLSLQANATRLQMGRYIVGWCPSGGGLNYDEFRRFHVQSLCQVTQLPHVEFDLNCDSEATLIIPHITAQGWASFYREGDYLAGNNGTIFIATYSPLAASTGSLNCSWTLTAHFTDVEVSLPIQPQMSGRARTRITRKIRPAEAEQNSADIGPLEATFSKVSKASAALSGIPFISSVAGPVSWASALAAQVASAFGWSRPHNAEHTQLVQRLIVPKMTNTDTADNSTVLAGMDSNTIEELSGFAGSDIDEMAISYITSISAYYGRTTWTTGISQGANLVGNRSLNPRSFYTSNAVAGTSHVTLTPLSFMSSFFSLYRGSIKLTIKLVKTEFHTGRLLVVFKPTDNAAGTLSTATFLGSSYEHREIIDIRYGNEFTLEFPYASVSPYRSTTGYDAAYGVFNIWVMNTLEAPPNVPQEVQLLYEISAGKDFELAEPDDMTGLPTQVYYPQMGTNVCEIVSEQIGNSTTTETDVPSRLCIGERFTSIRQMLKRFSMCVPTTQDLPPTVSHWWLIWQGDVAFLDDDGSSVNEIKPDTYTWFQSCYALQRGGMRGKIVPMDSDNGRAYTQLIAYKISSAKHFASQLWDFGSTPLVSSQRPMAISALETTGAVEVQVPYYSRFASSACSDMMGTNFTAPAGLTYNLAGPVPRTTVLTSFPSFQDKLIRPLVFRAISEDFSFGLFVSTPVITDWSQE